MINLTNLTDCIISGGLFSKVRRSLAFLQCRDRLQPYSSDSI
ncbi:MAG TPA: hypothetical protein V6D16_01115 [Candidatus Obscuribacterales bacterium]